MKLYSNTPIGDTQTDLCMVAANFSKTVLEVCEEPKKQKPMSLPAL